MQTFINTKKKVVLAFLLGISAVVIALIVSYLGFYKILGVVDNLAAPNQKLKTLHKLYQHVSQLEQRQRLEAIQNPGKPVRDFLRESHSLLATVDTLRSMPWSDTLQYQRLQDIQQILLQRDSLFIKYLQLKSNALKNKKFSRKFDTLTKILSNNVVLRDTSVRTTQKKKTTIRYNKDSIINHTAQKRSFFSRLFRKKQTPVVSTQPRERITEELVVTVDTLALAQRSNSIAEATRLIQELGLTELSRRKTQATRELALLKTTNVLFTQMIDIVRQVEAEEVLLAQKNNEAATYLFRESINKMLIILTVFCLVAAVLIYLILIDITRSNFYKTQLTREKEKAEQLSLVKQRFLDNMSHEIRTPLQSIIGFAEQLLRKVTPGTKTDVQAIYNSSEHLLHIVNEVLDYSRVDSGKLHFEKKRFYFLETVEEVASAVKVQAEKKDLRFFLDAELAENNCVVGDPFRLRQILYNLLGNAVKFTAAGHVKLACSTIIDKELLRVQFKIVDTGIGIRENEISKIFKRFEQANPSIGSVFGGSGLGLTIVQKLIDTQNGKLSVESLPGEGSCFTVDLTFEMAAEEPVNESKKMTFENSSAYVLVIDDDPSILQLCGLILKNAHVKYLLQDNPVNLFENQIDEEVTHILMDIRMGNVDGFELSRSLRKRIKKHVPIIAMSAMTRVGNETDFNDTFDALLLKPFHSHELISILNQFTVLKPENDFEAIKQLTLGDSGLLKSALLNFIQETENDIKSIEQLIRHRHVAELKEILHKMKGRIGQFGYLSVSNSLNQLENLLENNSSMEKIFDEINKLMKGIVIILSKTRDQLAELR